MQRGRSFPLNPHSRPFTPESVASSGDSKGEAAPEDVLHSPYEDEMHKILPPLTPAPPIDLLNTTNADDQGMTATTRPRIVDATEDLPICQPLPLAISPTAVTQHRPSLIQACNEVKAETERAPPNNSTVPVTL